MGACRRDDGFFDWVERRYWACRGGEVGLGCRHTSPCRTNPRTMIAQDRTSERLGKATRAWLAAFALALASMLVVARGLEPDPRGFGTHTQLGLWPCAFRATTGRSCPTCGMTTSFAWF